MFDLCNDSFPSSAVYWPQVCSGPAPGQFRTSPGSTLDGPSGPLLNGPWSTLVLPRVCSGPAPGPLLSDPRSTVDLSGVCSWMVLGQLSTTLEWSRVRSWLTPVYLWTGPGFTVGQPRVHSRTAPGPLLNIPESTLERPRVHSWISPGQLWTSPGPSLESSRVGAWKTPVHL